jgi:hypothetical protein
MPRTVPRLRFASFLLCAVMASMMAGCVTYPADENGNPIIPPQDQTVTVLNPNVRQKAVVAQSVYCNAFKNTRRIILRFIRAMDPEWVSVCEIVLAEEKAAEEAAARGSGE